ncbi:MAG: aldose epimerase family protein [Candidatus Limnocylindrales bacterium]
MTAARVREARVHGLDALILENAALRVTVLPGLGGHVSELLDRAADRDLLWHNPRTTPRPAPYGAFFDDWWSGGWDEIFPSGDRGTFRGEALPYMGELWCVPWTATAAMDGTSASITASGFGTVAPARFERTLSMVGDEPVLRVRYRIENLDIRPLPYAWGIHPAFAITDRSRIDHPGREMLVGVSSDPALGAPGERYTWPHLPDPTSPGGLRDMRLVRGRDAGVFGGHWALDLPAGWLALTDTVTRRGVALVFDREVLPHAWLWQVYGGWRGHHHLALEAWTSHPMDLNGAIEAGHARWLQTGEALETEVAFVLFDGLDAVAAVERVGEGFAVR